ncbi:hypothetical protein N7471_010213 [Penicillium samsonianum]|uniref:uncharacterized protein n=1 Tax=Penicillium samsonianum TaxID=1882272 RepID=UPI00254747BA|nr:uncharacterized protein N7471_010213 [Penicillium samsonianum]KAJ6128996.1 hypothetical protein N7471_010213 [Penicillium samsonianum]
MANLECAVAFLVLLSVGGLVVGAVVQLLASGYVQIIHFFLVPETRATIILDRVAKKRRPHEIHGFKLSLREIWSVWKRPFVMLLTRPIVLWLSLLSGLIIGYFLAYLSFCPPSICLDKDDARMAPNMCLQKYGYGGCSMVSQYFQSRGQ